jgi:hypothetical protein
MFEVPKIEMREGGEPLTHFRNKAGTMNNSAYSNSAIHSSSFSDTTCKRCGSTELFTRPQGVHTGLFCRECNLWQKWVSKGDARRFQTKPKPALATDLQPAAEKVDSCHDSCARRFEKIERELTILVRAVLACGVLQGCKVPPRVDVSDELVDRFVREVADE